MRCSKSRPKKEDGAVWLPDVCLGGLFSSSFLPLIISLPLRSRGPASFAVKDSLNTELLKLGLSILGVVTGIQAGVPHFHFRRLLRDGSSLSVTAHASLQLLSSQSHSFFFFFPQWNRTQKTSELFLQTSGYSLLLTQLGMVRFGQGSLCEQKF